MKTSQQISKVFQISYPVKDVYVTQPFGANYNNFYSQLGMAGHNGIDFRAAMGTPVFAVCDGVITQVYNGDPTDTTKGRFVKFETEPRMVDGVNIKLEFMYFHLEKSADGLREGMPIEEGNLIGFADNTGTMTTGSHLHFGMYPWEEISGIYQKYNNNYGGALDPMLLFKDLTDKIMFKKEKGKPSIYAIIKGKKVMVVDMPTLEALDGLGYVEVDNLDEFADGGTLVWVSRIIN